MNSNTSARAPEHVTETRSRAIVNSLLDAERFIPRETTERDYGIDQLIEVVADGNPSGTYLLLQIRGTEGELPRYSGSEDVRAPSFSVRELVRAEHYAIPVLLARVPVNDQPRRAYFLWLQEYIQVALDRYDGWRSQTTVTLRIPGENVLPGDNFANRLVEIAAEPIRAAALGGLARIAHEVRWANDDPRSLVPLYREALAIRALNYPAGTSWAPALRSSLSQALAAGEILLGERELDEPLRRELTIGRHASDVVRQVPGQEAFIEVYEAAIDAHPEESLLSTLHWHVESAKHSLSLAPALIGDVGLRRAAWEASGEHRF